MPPRAYVLIFVCWALLAIITPTLVFWSASARPNRLGSNAPGDEDDDLKGRRLMQGYLRRSPPRVNQTEEAPAPAPLAPSPAGQDPRRLWPVRGDA